MSTTTSPYQPYAAKHESPSGPGDARPTALQVVEDCGKLGGLRDKHIFIIRANGGLGLETARALHKGGATLYLTARDLSKLDAAVDDLMKGTNPNEIGPRPVTISLDLDDLDSVRKAVDQFRASSDGMLDILICNAGIMASPYGKTKDGYEQQLGVNYLVHFLLFDLLRDNLLASAKSSGHASRVITLSTAVHRFGGIRFQDRKEFDAWNAGEGYQKWLAYSQSKTAVLYMAASISRRYGDRGIRGFSVHPGGIMTGLGRYLTPEDYAVFGNMEKMMPLMKSPEQGAATSVWAAVSDHFESGPGGQYLENVGETVMAASGDGMDKPGYAEFAVDEKQQDRLWALTRDVLNLPEDT